MVGMATGIVVGGGNSLPNVAARRQGPRVSNDDAVIYTAVVGRADVPCALGRDRRDGHFRHV